MDIEKLDKFAKFLHVKGLVKMTIKRPKRGNKHFAAKKFKGLRAEEFHVDGFLCVCADDGERAKAHIVFLHGGSYVAEGLLLHRKFMERLIREYGYRVTYIDYPLAPEHGAKETHAVLAKAYGALKNKFPEDEFVFLGDSAGGGLALAFLQKLSGAGGAMPKKSVLLSPWLDLSLSRPEAAEYEEKDPTLSIDGLLFAGREYAKDLPLTDPLCSPIFGSMENLGDLLVTVGTHELFYPDCVWLKERAEGAAGTSVSVAVFENMFHDFAMTPLKESDAALALIDSFLSGKPLSVPDCAKLL